MGSRWTTHAVPILLSVVAGLVLVSASPAMASPAPLPGDEYLIDNTAVAGSSGAIGCITGTTQGAIGQSLYLPVPVALDEWSIEIAAITGSPGAITWTLYNLVNEAVGDAIATGVIASPALGINTVALAPAVTIDAGQRVFMYWAVAPQAAGNWYALATVLTGATVPGGAYHTSSRASTPPPASDLLTYPNYDVQVRIAGVEIASEIEAAPAATFVLSDGVTVGTVDYSVTLGDMTTGLVGMGIIAALTIVIYLLWRIARA